MFVVWVVVLLACLVGTALASRRAVTSALRITESINVPPAVVGLTVMAIGTDLPEMANSIVASATDHGDVNVGDSMGSVLTQATLTLGLLCLAKGETNADKKFVMGVATATVFAVVVVRILADDGQLGHGDGLILILMWAAGTALLGHGGLGERQVFPRAGGSALRHAASTIGWLAIVGAMAVGVIQSFLRLAEMFGIPEFMGSFVALSIGTSLPELFVDWTAIRRGASSMAIAEVFGSSFVDATLSIGIGPAIFATDVSSDVFTGTVLAAVGVAVAAILVARSQRYDWRLTVPLLITYASIQSLIVVLGR